MCGIFGVSGVPDAAHLTLMGLFALQHRGQESAGIVAVDAGKATVLRRMGLISEAISASDLAALPGPVSVGHTRYSTAGTSTIENAQPVFARFKGGHVAIAHNGNLTNADAVRAQLEAAGSIFASTMDTEVIVHRLAKASASSPEEMLAQALQGLEGAYSLIATIGDTLLAARDPHGWRPLVMGELNGSTVFASETCALDIVGARVVRDVEAGEIIAVDGSGTRSLKPFGRTPLNKCVFEFVYFARPDSTIFSGSVDRARRALGRALAKEAPAPGADLVFAVPDSSNAAALGYSEEAGLRLEHALIRNHYIGRTFIQPTQEGRTSKVRVKYNPVHEVIAGKSVVMIDDSIVRGTTTRGLVALVRAAGAREVHMRVASPPITGPCYYGIDIPTRKELIAANKTVPEIAQTIGVDSLAYLSLDGMLNAVPGGPDGFCHACFSGQYPITPPRGADVNRAGRAD